ncbi:hypothetical protein JCM11251_003940 [Rhodosporidiobolus azoricus]
MASFGRFPAPPQPYALPASTSPLPPIPHPASVAAQAPPAAVQPGTLPPGTVVNVGEYRVVVERFLSEGGFAHVYLATCSVPLPHGSPTATTKHVLKRMVVQDKRGVEEVGREVDVMRQLKNHPKIVNMIEASVADLPGGMDGSKGYEIYILMEWCPGGGIIDMMNTRLQNRLTESEILKIFSDVVEAVAHMHYQSPPLIHRDLKVENILLTPPQTYKLCDFGSTTKPLPREKVPTSVEGIQKIELEINKTTTLQYRAPELVDVWGRKGFDEKIDIWALGVFLYKLCYYTTPFEEHGPLAILNAQYKFPPYPAYSPSIRGLISSMLQEKASNRPNIYQVHEGVCRLRGVGVVLENKYALSATSSSGFPSRSPALSPSNPSASVLSTTAAPPPPSQSSYLATDSIVPGRRGRPNKPSPNPPPEANRLVRTGLATAGSQGEKPAPGVPGSGTGWESFGAGMGASPGLKSGFDSAPPLSAASTSNGAGGFGDAFAPSATEGDLKVEVELPSNAAMFAELVPPSAKEGGRSPSPMNVLRAHQQQVAFGGVPTAGTGAKGGAVGEDDDRKRFEAAFPDLGDLDKHDSDMAAFSSAAAAKPLPPQPASLIDAPSPSPPLPATNSASAGKMPSQLTGEDASSAAPGPPLPRRPPTSTSSTSQPDRLPTPGAPSPSTSPAPPASAREGFKPELVSRGSQTSPHLLASWRNGSGASAPAKEAEVREEKEDRGHALRQSSVPEFALEAPSPDVEKQKPVDLLSGDDDEEFAPRSFVASPSSAAALLPSIASPPAPSTSSLPGYVASKRMSYSTSSSSSAQPGPEREKFRPVTKRTSWLPSSSSANASPVPSPKPSLPPKHSASPAAPIKELADDLDRAEQDGRSVEERFPALAIEEPTPPIPSGLGSSPQARDSEKWEKVVEKEPVDDGDSSDEERVEQVEPEKKEVSGKVPKPDFDDDDFAPRPPLQQQYGSTSTRPKFGGSFRPTQQQPPLSTSPAPISLSSDASPAPSANPSLVPGERGFSTSSTSSSSATGGGNIDLGPALASIRKFAPSGNADAPPPPAKHLLDSLDDGAEVDDFPPSSGTSSARSPPPPVLSPKPLPSGTSSTRHRSSSNGSAKLNSLLSRYEGSGIALTGGPPPLGKKPAGLRKDSTGSNSSLPSTARYGNGGAGLVSGTSAHGYQRDAVQPRALPQWATNASGERSPALPEKQEQEAQQMEAPNSPALPPKPSTPTSFGGAGSRAPFKPTPPPGSPASPSFAAGHRTSYSVGGGRPAFGSAGGAAPPTGAAGGGEGDAEERFAGVSNMKSRWENMAKTQAPKGGADRGAAGKVRKEWAAI